MTDDQAVLITIAGMLIVIVVHFIYYVFYHNK